jgi:hypothetical protein
MRHLESIAVVAGPISVKGCAVYALGYVSRVNPHLYGVELLNNHE